MRTEAHMERTAVTPAGHKSKERTEKWNNYIPCPLERRHVPLVVGLGFPAATFVSMARQAEAFLRIREEDTQR